jgi:hypothetical protein
MSPGLKPFLLICSIIFCIIAGIILGNAFVAMAMRRPPPTAPRITASAYPRAEELVLFISILLFDLKNYF